MTVEGGTSQACAACKYQRRRCYSDCPLAPYFPPDKPKQFQNAHRLFGVSNILKILNKLQPPQKAEAMRSIIYEADIRDHYPVHGCLGLIFTLHFQIQHTQLELDAINTQLSVYRHHHHSSQLQLASLSSSSSSSTTANTSNYYLFLDTLPNNTSTTANTSTSNYLFSDTLPNNTNNNDKKNVKTFWTSNSMIAVTSSGIQTSLEMEREYDEISPYFDTVDEDPDYELSSELSLKELSLKDTIQHVSENVSENELKRMFQRMS